MLLRGQRRSVDANIVMTGNGKFVEVQSSGEEAISHEELADLIKLAERYR